MSDDLDADARLVAGKPAPSERTRLTPTIVVDAAIAFIDERGLAELTMRRLGQELGVEAMALYRHVVGREELLDAIVVRVMAEMEDDDDVPAEPDAGWQDFLHRLAHGVRRVALRHPKVFPLVVSRPPEAPWLRPPLRDLRWVEVFLNSLLEEGFDRERTVAAYRAFTSFLLGHLLLEVSAMGADVGPLDVLEDDSDPPRSALAPYPRVEEMRGDLSEDHSAPEFDESLENLLDRIARLRSEQ
ncbi:TetR/AcrR family transcriptional regulator C-terminal domain-containing protein [Nocardioides aquaticus]|uniref:TetR/AcrR family transcriptional regulator C-terminal domain-containing protein n=1 Tax=Nocardioides aquaticus TaxID=160826 RepID=UPI0031D38806